MRAFVTGFLVVYRSRAPRESAPGERDELNACKAMVERAPQS